MKEMILINHLHEDDRSDKYLQPYRRPSEAAVRACRMPRYFFAILIVAFLFLLSGNIPTSAKTESSAGFIEVPQITGEFTDALAIAIEAEIEGQQEDVLLDFGTMPSGRLFRQRRPGDNSGGPTTLDRMIIVTPALMAFREYSVPDLERYLITMTNDVHARTMLGVRLFQDKRLEESLELLRQALRINPLEVRAAELHSGILLQQALNPLPESIPDEIHRLLDAHPGNNVIRFNLACAYARSGQTGSALRQLDILARSGWGELVYHITDRDFASLRAEADFVALQNVLLSSYAESLNRYLLGSSRPEPLAP